MVPEAGGEQTQRSGANWKDDDHIHVFYGSNTYIKNYVSLGYGIWVSKK